MKRLIVAFVAVVALSVAAGACGGGGAKPAAKTTAPTKPGVTFYLPPATTTAPIATLAEACAELHKQASPGGAGSNLQTETLVQLKAVFATVPDPIVQGAISGGGSDRGTELQAMLIWCIENNDGA
ncbi:MAG: hypothetical protein M3046_13710 [Actinomycetota bacterium]|nr:hypothetical protein [Actinomycetota bacterium]MDQ6910290.1 hypothetical protein [Actinomycetota bacterium]